MTSHLSLNPSPQLEEMLEAGFTRMGVGVHGYDLYESPEGRYIIYDPKTDYIIPFIECEEGQE